MMTLTALSHAARLHGTVFRSQTWNNSCTICLRFRYAKGQAIKRAFGSLDMTQTVSNAAHKPSPAACVSVCGKLRPLAFTPTQYVRASASVCVCVRAFVRVSVLIGFVSLFVAVSSSLNTFFSSFLLLLFLGGGEDGCVCGGGRYISHYNSVD